MRKSPYRMGSARATSMQPPNRLPMISVMPSWKIDRSSSLMRRSWKIRSASCRHSRMNFARLSNTSGVACMRPS